MGPDVERMRPESHVSLRARTHCRGPVCYCYGGNVPFLQIELENLHFGRAPFVSDNGRIDNYPPTHLFAFSSFFLVADTIP